MDISSHLDKMNLSFYKADTVADLLGEISDLAIFHVVEDMHPFAHYDQAYRLQCGAIVNLSESDTQGGRIDLGGQALSNIRQAGISDYSLLVLFEGVPKKRRVTRVDWCFNVHGAGRVEDTLEAWDTGEQITKLRSQPEVVDHRRGNNGMTVYYGSRMKSDKFVKVYDKAAEQGLLMEAWNRVEMTLKKPFSDAFVEDVHANRGHIDLIGRSYLKTILDFPTVDWWQLAMAGDTMQPREARQHSDRFWQWLNDSVYEWIIKRAGEDCDQHAKAQEFAERLLWGLADLNQDCSE